MALPVVGTETAPSDERLTFREVFESEATFMWRALRRLGVHDRELEDVAHEVFIVVHRRFAEYDHARPLRPWLFGVAHRVASDWRALARNRHEVLGSDAEPRGSHVGAERAFAARDLLARALDKLDDDRRAVLVAHDLEGCTMPEIAMALGIPLATAYSRLRVARDELLQVVTRFRIEEERV